MMKLFLLVLYGLILFNPFINADVWINLSEYQLGKGGDATVVTEIDNIIIMTNPSEMGSVEDKLISVLESSNSTLDGKKQSLRFLDRIGTERSIAVVAKLLGEKDLALLARRLLESRKNSLVAFEALLAELPRVEDSLKVGIIATLAEHGNVSAVPHITPYIKSDNSILALSACNAIGRLGGALAYTHPIEDAVVGTISREDKIRVILDTTESIGSVYLKNYLENGANCSLQIQAFVKLHVLDEYQAEKSFKIAFAESSAYQRQALVRTAMELDTTYQREFVRTFSSLSISDKLTVLGAISELGLSEYEGDLISLLVDSKGETFNQIVYALASIGGEASFHALYHEFQEDDSNPAITYAITQLELPLVDEHLLKVVSGQSTSDIQERIAAITPLVLRNPDGSASVFSDLIDPIQIDVLRKAGFKAIEAAGDIENCKSLANLIVSNDVFKRQAQQSLKKAALRINKGDDLWQSTFEPILKSSSTTLEQKESLMVIIDGIPTGGSLNYLKEQIMLPTSPLRSLAIRMLGRWPKYTAGEVWIELVLDESSTVDDQRAALKGLTRILTRDEIERNANRRLELAARAIKTAPNTSYKIKILECFKDSDEYTRRRMKVHFLPLLDNLELSSIVKSLMVSE
jgi:hypothetical protein